MAKMPCTRKTIKIGLTSVKEAEYELLKRPIHSPFPFFTGYLLVSFPSCFQVPPSPQHYILPVPLPLALHFPNHIFSSRTTLKERSETLDDLVEGILSAIDKSIEPILC